ncbi:MAG: hypothetical protein NXH81_14610 [Halieaceae bacterium]|uniref:hypothetical protein n=1 Tax=Haliea alexandrii TaxID=2448162 RepID=UPI001304EA2C|nr:hypothetical protein [Haliea alexandrii]MCR9186627.1 hypothetical protein [Halieaceae bacterium]
MPERIRFEILNGLGEADVKKAKHIVYAHRCPAGVYVGMSEDPVRRWKQHVHHSVDANSGSYNDNFKRAIRAYGHSGFTHYVLATASFPKSAKSKEAAAIKFYGHKLNSRAEVIDCQEDYGFRPIDTQIPKIVFLEAKAREDNSDRGGSYNKRNIRARVVYEGGRKRFVSLPNEYFPEGLRVQCNRDRDEFDVGDVVEVSVSLSTKPTGGLYLVAATTAKITKVES